MRKAVRGWAKGFLALLLLGNLCCAPLPPGPNPNPNGVIYALDEFNKAIYVYDNALGITGSVAPSRTISGTVNTTLSSPTVLTVDGLRDLLYVTDSGVNGGSVLTFGTASTLNGDVGPIRIYPGVVKAGAMFYDSVPGHDRLYVTDVTNQAIMVWDSISTLPTGTPPSRTIQLGYVPSGIVVDTQRDLLYVGDPAFQGIKVYDQPSTLSNNSPAIVKNSFTDSTRPLQNVNGLTMNIPNDLLFVTESSDIFIDDNNDTNDFTPSVEMFDAASTINGTSVVQPASRELMGASTGLTINLRQPIFLVTGSAVLPFGFKPISRRSMSGITPIN
jgi:hypothetical protein